MMIAKCPYCGAENEISDITIYFACSNCNNIINNDNKLQKYYRETPKQKKGKKDSTYYRQTLREKKEEEDFKWIKVVVAILIGLVLVVAILSGLGVILFWIIFISLLAIVSINAYRNA
ncbi:MAG: hypothetical protein FWH54_02680 [Methanobrevibacter sp.]|nr:hypothetical protein [Methanobrevibacter sp.]